MKTLIFAAILTAVTTSSQARVYCDIRDNIVTQLTARYSESQSGFGLTNGGNQLLELFISTQGTWTILLTKPDGTSCVMASGHSWDNTKSKPESKSG